VHRFLGNQRTTTRQIQGQERDNGPRFRPPELPGQSLRLDRRSVGLPAPRTCDLLLWQTMCSGERRLFDEVARPSQREWGKHMRVQLDLSLPREAVSVPLARHTVSAALLAAGVEPACVSDVGVALSEACTNAVQHAVAGVTYEVMVSISDEQVAIEVVDSGSGFGQREVAPGTPDHAAENGRGMTLMHALSDLGVFDSVDGEGGSVHLTKRLRWVQGAQKPGVAQSVERPR